MDLTGTHLGTGADVYPAIEQIMRVFDNHKCTVNQALTALAVAAATTIYMTWKESDAPLSELYDMIDTFARTVEGNVRMNNGEQLFKTGGEA